MKLHTDFRLVSKLVTLNDLERRIRNDRRHPRATSAVAEFPVVHFSHFLLELSCCNVNLLSCNVQKNLVSICEKCCLQFCTGGNYFRPKVMNAGLDVYTGLPVVC